MVQFGWVSMRFAAQIALFALCATLPALAATPQAQVDARPILELLSRRTMRIQYPPSTVIHREVFSRFTQVEFFGYGILEFHLGQTI